MGIKINPLATKAATFKKGEILTNINKVVVLVLEERAGQFDAMVLTHVNYPAYTVVRNIQKENTHSPWEIFTGEIVLTSV